MQLPEISDAASYLAPISELDRACKYPYEAPEGGFVLASRALICISIRRTWNRWMKTRMSEFWQGEHPFYQSGQTAPNQLLRKFGLDAFVPVTPARLHDCDITHAAILGYYAAVPCTAFPSPGTIVDLNVAWLDDNQLAQMHHTEGINVAYDFVEMETVEHQFALRTGRVYGYAARAGVLDCGDGEPAGLSAIPAHGRKFKTMTQAEANAKLRQLAGVDDDRSMLQFIAEMQADKSARDEIISGYARMRFSHLIRRGRCRW